MSQQPLNSIIGPPLTVTDTRPDRTKVYNSPKPILDRILIKRIESVAEVDGFVIAEKYREKSRRGEVIAVGDYVVLGQQCHKITDFVDVGDIVVYGEYSAEAQDHTDPTIATTFLVRLADIRTVERLQRG